MTGLFRDYGYRRLRHRARIKFLVADWGPEKFREVLEKEYLGYALPDGPAPAPPPHGIRDHVGVHSQRQVDHALTCHDTDASAREPSAGELRASTVVSTVRLLST